MAKDSADSTTITTSPVPVVYATKRPLIDAAAALKVPPHLLAGVKALRRWDDLYDVTDAELTDAVAAVSSITMR